MTSHQIDRGQIAQLQTWLPQALQHEQPVGEVGVDQNILPTNLKEKTGMTNERHSHLTVAGQLRLMSSSGSGSNRRIAH